MEFDFVKKSTFQLSKEHVNHISMTLHFNL